MEKDDEAKGKGNSYDFGNRMHDPRLGRFLSRDKFAYKFPSQSPYIFAGNTPIMGIDVNGDSLYVLVHVTGYKRGDDMMEAAALTRKYDIEHSNGFDSNRDKVVVISVSDLGKLEEKVEAAVIEYSPNYGGTVEFGIFSHSALEGPTGGEDTSGPDAISPNQLNTTGWGKIDFGWSDGKNNRAIFYGCRSGVYRPDKKTSFTRELSSLPNLKDVTLGGQSDYSFPSKYVNHRSPSIAHTVGEHLPVVETIYPPFVGVVTNIKKTYMVAGEKTSLSTEKATVFGGAAKKMNYSKNGKHLGQDYQPGDEK